METFWNGWKVIDLNNDCVKFIRMNWEIIIPIKFSELCSIKELYTLCECQYLMCNTNVNSQWSYHTNFPERIEYLSSQLNIINPLITKYKESLIQASQRVSDMFSELNNNGG